MTGRVTQQGLGSHGAARIFLKDELVDHPGPSKLFDSCFLITSVLKFTGETTQAS